MPATLQGCFPSCVKSAADLTLLQDDTGTVLQLEAHLAESTSSGKRQCRISGRYISAGTGEGQQLLCP